ncbi:hypothetical protein [Mitsuaria sp. 7]|uniref:hypothetical protein n=1 Tax=Mitsuaria sp. 7 TaxID=1658665 RepID=UPI0007DD6807|nr:hypothetical protein [Mitsuaria sp. 7]ANH67147.1 hypothetical protein ABE85_05380 [Mitsuaria sp. 7]
MDQAALYDCIRRAGGQVLVFEDHPGFFGNWRSRIQTGSDRLEVVCDHREGWLTLWRALPDQKQERVGEVQLLGLDERGVLDVLASWLSR